MHSRPGTHGRTQAPYGKCPEATGTLRPESRSRSNPRINNLPKTDAQGVAIWLRTRESNVVNYRQNFLGQWTFSCARVPPDVTHPSNWSQSAVPAAHSSSKYLIIEAPRTQPSQEWRADGGLNSNGLRREPETSCWPSSPPIKVAVVSRPSRRRVSNESTAPRAAPSPPSSSVALRCTYLRRRRTSHRLYLALIATGIPGQLRHGLPEH